MKKLSNSFSTGGGGTHFENKIQAAFLLSMLVDGFSFVTNLPIRKLRFQAHAAGYNTDDLVVFSQDDNRSEKLLCQIKHDFSLTRSDKEAKETIDAAWKDFCSERFDKTNDKIAVFTAPISKTTISAAKKIHEIAISKNNEIDFLMEINAANYVSKETKDKFFDLKFLLEKAKEATISDNEMWQFCRCFQIIVFDLDFEDSINKTLLTTLIKLKSSENPSLLWAKLIEYASSCNDRAQEVILKNFDNEILKCFNIINNETPSKQQLSNIEIDIFWSKIAVIGSWNSSNEFDKKILESILGDTYANIENRLNGLLYKNRDFIKYKNGLWTILNKKALIEKCSCFYIDNSIKNMFEIALDVLQHAKSPNDFKFRVSENNTASLELLKNILEGLAILNNENLPNCSKEKLNQLQYDFFDKLFSECKHEFWECIGDELKTLAEISPSNYLNIIENYIKGQSDEVKKMIPKKTDYLFGNRCFYSLLWSLEALAWDETFLIKSIRCLCELNEFDCSSINCSNTPLNSIVAILLSWYPQTLANIKKCKDALSMMVEEFPLTAWEVIKRILPSGESAIIGNAKPQFILTIIERKEISKEDYTNYVKFIFEKAICIAEKNLDKLAELLKYVVYLPLDDSTNLFNQIKSISSNKNDEEKYIVWSKLKELRHSIIKINNDIEPDIDAYQELKNLIISIEPKSPIIKNKFLFTSYFYEDSIEDDGTIKPWEIKEKKKLEAVKKIFENGGFLDVLKLSQGTNQEDNIFNILGRIVNLNQLNEILIIGNNRKDLLRCITVLLQSFIYTNQDFTLKTLTITKLDKEYLMDIIINLNVSKDIADFAKLLLDDKENIYWEKVNIPKYFNPNCGLTLKDLIGNLINVKRYVTIINLLYYTDKSNEIDDDLIYNILLKAAQIETNERFDAYSVQQVIKRLQDNNKINLEKLSEIEMLYLPWLNEYSGVIPRAIKTRIANEPAYFCELISYMYKKHNEKQKIRINKNVTQRLFQIFFQFNVVPGTDWKLFFHEDVFKNWISYVLQWSKENDREIVVQQTIGNGLAYSINNNGDIEKAILKVLDNRNNEDIRKGFMIGIFNKRGVHCVDKEGKPEKELSKKYDDLASKYEEMGYSRVGEIMRKISNNYLQEAQRNIDEFAKDNDNNDATD